MAASVIQSALYARDEKCLSAIMESSSGELEAFSESEAVVVETVLPVGGAHVSVIKEPDEDESGNHTTTEWHRPCSGCHGWDERNLQMIQCFPQSDNLSGPLFLDTEYTSKHGCHEDESPSTKVSAIN